MSWTFFELSEASTLVHDVLDPDTYGLNNPVKYQDPSCHCTVEGDDDKWSPLPKSSTLPVLPPPPIVPPSPPGGDPASPWQVGVEWLTGSGPRHHEYREGDPFTELLQKHYYIEEVRTKIAQRVARGNYHMYEEDYWLGGIEGVPKYFQDYSNVLTFGKTGNLAVTYLGSYELTYYIVSVDRKAGTVQVLFHVENESTLASATHPPVLGYTSFWNNVITPVVNDLAAAGPMSTVTQGFWWTEVISFRKRG